MKSQKDIDIEILKQKIDFLSILIIESKDKRIKQIYEKYMTICLIGHSVDIIKKFNEVKTK